MSALLDLAERVEKADRIKAARNALAARAEAHRNSPAKRRTLAIVSAALRARHFLEKQSC